MKTRKFLAALLAIVMIAGFVTVPAFAAVVVDPEGVTETPDGTASNFNPRPDWEDNIDYNLTAITNPTATSAAVTGAKGAVPAGTITATIDLVAETLTVTIEGNDQLSIAAYSLDGGTKWKTGSIGSAEGADISKLLNKEMTLVLTTSYDKKAKGPSVGVAKADAVLNADGTEKTPAVENVDAALVVTLPKINARPKMDKYVVNYAIAADATGVTAGGWVLAAKEATVATKKGLQVAVAGSDKKTPAVTILDDKGTPNNAEDDETATWGQFPDPDVVSGTEVSGINVKPLPEGGKPEKTIYLARIAPVGDGAVYTPGSKAAKYNVTSEIKAPKLKADYKKELIKTKVGISWFEADVVTYTGGTEATTDDETFFTVGTVSTFTDKEKAKTGISLAATATTDALYGETLGFYTAATAKKAASAIQVYNVAPRGVLVSEALSPSKGKLKIDTKKYEVYDKVKQKWGGMPKVTAGGELQIRMKATAKGGKEDESTWAAGETRTLRYVWGVYQPNEKDPSKDKKGITEAYILDKALGATPGSATIGASDAISGVTGTALAETKITVTLKDAFFKEAADNKIADVKSWFGALPAGLSAAATITEAETDKGFNVAEITVSGTPTAAINATAIQLKIPMEALVDEPPIVVTVDSEEDEPKNLIDIKDEDVEAAMTAIEELYKDDEVIEVDIPGLVVGDYAQIAAAVKKYIDADDGIKALKVVTAVTPVIGEDKTATGYTVTVTKGPRTDAFDIAAAEIKATDVVGEANKKIAAAFNAIVEGDHEVTSSNAGDEGALKTYLEGTSLFDVDGLNITVTITAFTEYTPAVAEPATEAVPGKFTFTVTVVDEAGKGKQLTQTGLTGTITE
ncbi:MAG: hypothetical protein LBR85_03615 [Oscillospiraceae bacterium]|jgi:hypothetical protein|nr:hypothetical protein [Oscillospiraceae bacterium]